MVSALRPGLLRQDGVRLALVHDLHQHVQRATVQAVLPLQLSLLQAMAAPPDLLHREEQARCLVDDHDAVCADSVRAHQPAQLDEEPMRVGVLLLRATQKSLDPSLAETDVGLLCVEPVVHPGA